MLALLCATRVMRQAALVSAWATVLVLHLFAGSRVAQWQPRAEALALAESTALKGLQCSLHAFSHSDSSNKWQLLQADAKDKLAVLEKGLNGVEQTAPGEPAALGKTLQEIKVELGRTSSVDERPGANLRYRSLVLRLAAWRRAVLFTWDGAGCCHSDADAPQMHKPVRLFVNQKYVVDAADSTDIVCQFLQPDSKLNTAMGVSGSISLAR